MKSFLEKIVFILLFACDVFALTVETMDEQVNSNNLMVLRLRIRNETGEPLYSTRVKFFVSGESGRPVVDAYDLGGAILNVDSLNGSLWAVTLVVDTLPSGIFPYESGICLGIHKADWQPRDKSRDPSYIASSSFVVNDKVELNVDRNHLPDASPLVLTSGTKIVLGEGDSVPFAWHSIPNAEKYRLTIYSSDSQLIYQKETYKCRESVALDAGNYLWKVEAKNTVTDYASAGVGAGFNYLSVEELIHLHTREIMSHNITSASGHKDTPMLVVGWGEFAELREWDRPHLNRMFLDENESHSCWAVAIKNLNHFYGGNLSLDEIRWYVNKNRITHLFDSINAFGFLREAEASPQEMQKGLNYALDSTGSYNVLFNHTTPLTYDEMKKILGRNQEIIINVSVDTNSNHIMLISALITATEGNYVRCVNVDNNGNYGTLSVDSLLGRIVWYMVIDAPSQTVRNMSPLLGVEHSDGSNLWIEWVDSDDDGVTNFDEIYRFGTNPELVDSDSDGVNDKDEIYSYTILEKSRLNLMGSYKSGNADLNQMLFIFGIDAEYMADVDGDGLRAELDPDSDNDGLLDGVDSEPYRANGTKISLETNELPKEIMLYAQKQLSVNDWVTCKGDVFEYCAYASEDTECDYGMFMGVGTSAALLYARNNVFIRSNLDAIFAVNYYGTDDLASVRPDGRVTIDKLFDIEDWPWKLNIVLPDFDEGDSVLFVHSGDTCFLSDDDHFKILKVESGGIIYLPTGNVYIGDLQLDAESLIKFSRPTYETNLYVKGELTWRGKFCLYYQIGLRELAKGFRLFYYGKERIFIDANWGGTIIAPNAKIVLGQTHKKDLFGQFYADEIEVHQQSKLEIVPFKPEQEPSGYALYTQQ